MILNSWKTRQIDFVQAYPQAPVKVNNIYMKIPRGFEIEGAAKDEYLLHIRPNIYGHPYCKHPLHFHQARLSTSLSALHSGKPFLSWNYFVRFGIKGSTSSLLLLLSIARSSKTIAVHSRLQLYRRSDLAPSTSTHNYITSASTLNRVTSPFTRLILKIKRQTF